MGNKNNVIMSTVKKENLINNLFNSDKQKFNTLIKNYETSWNNIKDIAIRYGCKSEMKIHEINNNLGFMHYINYFYMCFIYGKQSRTRSR